MFVAPLPGGEPLPPDVQRFADEIRLVQQRIQRLAATRVDAATWSRELRRAVQAGRHDVAEGRALLARLASKLTEDEAGQSGSGR